MEQNYIQEIICKILVLQNQEFNPDANGCDRPVLGPAATPSAYNTRPVQLFNRYTAEPWTFSYTSGEVTSTIDTFRIEAMEDNTVTVRLLSGDATSGYTSTNQFVTIHLSTIGAIRCFPDVFITL